MPESQTFALNLTNTECGRSPRRAELLRIHFAATALCVLALVGCASSSPPDDSVQQDFRRGISELRGTHDDNVLRARVLRTLTRLRRDRAPTTTTRRAKVLAIQGFGWTLKGIESRIDFDENDSGNVEAATRDAKRADRSLSRGARLLRAAGRILGVYVGSVNGF